MDKFTINNKVYFVKDLDFDFLVTLDKNDIKVENMTRLAAINCFVAYCGDMTEKQASKEISDHVISGGKLDDVFNAYAKALQDSGFFRTLMEQTETGQEEVESEVEKTPKKTRKTVKAEVSE